MESLLFYLESSDTIARWKKVVGTFGVPMHVIGHLPLALEMCQRADINSVEQLEHMLVRAESWGPKYLKHFYLNTWGVPPKKPEVNMDVIGIICNLIIPSYPSIFSKEVLEKSHGYGESWRAIEAAVATITPPWWWSKEARIRYLCTVFGAILGSIIAALTGF